jgi:cysteine desulfurase/selenocysteine lyase
MRATASDDSAGQRQISPPAASIDQSPWQWWREQMPICGKWAYFDHAAVAPLSGPAAEAGRLFMDQAATAGDTVWPQWAAKIEHLRRSTAELVGAEPAEICMIPNTSSGISLVAEGWPWQQGDNVIVPEGEFPSNIFPWLNQRERGVEVRLVPRHDGQVRVPDLIDRVDNKTRIIAVSWVGYASGYRVDIASLVQEAHQRGVLVFLDAIQGLGLFPLDVRKVSVDFLAADGHKWLLGPEGAGIAMIRREHLDKIRCGNVGWGSVKNSHDYKNPVFELRDTAARFESGSANMVGAAALSASMDLFLQIRRQHGEGAIAKRILELTVDLDRQLHEAGATTRLPSDPEHQSGILTFDVPGVDPIEVRKTGLEQNVVVSCRDGGVRASVHAYNDADDLRRLVSVVRTFS